MVSWNQWKIENSFPFYFKKKNELSSVLCFFRLIYKNLVSPFPLSLSLSLSPPNFRFLLLLRLSLWLINSSDCYSSSSLQDPFSASKFELCFTVLASPPFLLLRLVFHSFSSICFLCIVLCSFLVLWTHVTKHKAPNYIAFN